MTRFSYGLGSTRFGILAAQKLGRADKKLGGGGGEGEEGTQNMRDDHEI